MTNLTMKAIVSAGLGWIAAGTIFAASLTPVSASDAAKATSIFSAPDFSENAVSANGTLLHYVTAGKGDPVILIPGWPESWYAWRHVMNDLVASGRKVYAIDPRGFGDSAKPATGYDLKTASDDIHAFIIETGLTQKGPVDIVSHDVGTWIAYAHASAYPKDVRRLVLSEALIPGTPPAATIPNDAQNVKSWHFGFNRLSDLPEMLVEGHERAYLTWLFANKSVRAWMIDPAALDEYVRVFSAPGAARAGFEYYRQAFSDEGLAQAKLRMSAKLEMPILTIAGAGSLGPAMEKNTNPLGSKVRGVVLDGCGHYVLEECGGEFAKAVTEFWSEN